MEIAAPPRRCRNCNGLLASTSRPDRRYCTASCRVTAYRQRQAEPAVTVTELDRLVALLDAPQAEVALVAGVAQAAAADWKAAAWLLQRRFGTRWNLAGKPAALAADDSDDPLDGDWPPGAS